MRPPGRATSCLAHVGDRGDTAGDLTDEPEAEQEQNAGGALKLKSVVEVVSELTALPDNAGRDNPASQETDAIITSGIEDVRTFLGA